MTDKPYIVRYRLMSEPPVGQSQLWREIVGRKDIWDKPTIELIQEFDSKAQALAFCVNYASVLQEARLYKLQVTY